MNTPLWQSDTIDVDEKTEADVQASELSVALRFHDGRWIFEMHLDDERALALAAQINEGVIQHRAMQVRP